MIHNACVGRVAGPIAIDAVPEKYGRLKASAPHARSTTDSIMMPTPSVTSSLVMRSARRAPTTNTRSQIPLIPATMATVTMIAAVTSQPCCVARIAAITPPSMTNWPCAKLSRAVAFSITAKPSAMSA